MNSTTNYTLYKGMIDSINLDKIFGILTEEIFEIIPEDVIPKGMKNTIKAATYVIIPTVTRIYKDSFLLIYKNEFSDEEFGKLLAFYGPGSTLWDFFNTPDFFPWLKDTIRKVIQKRIEGLDLTVMTTVELQNLVKVNLFEALDLLPEWVRIGSDSKEYTNSDLCRRESTLGDKITAEADKLMSEVNWYDLLEKSGIELPNED
jgi:hypothetical protein